MVLIDKRYLAVLWIRLFLKNTYDQLALVDSLSFFSALACQSNLNPDRLLQLSSLALIPPGVAVAGCLRFLAKIR